MAERVDGNRGFANLQVFDENSDTLLKSPRESKLSMKSVKSIIKAVVLLSKTGENVDSVNKVVRITLQKQWFEKKL